MRAIAAGSRDARLSVAACLVMMSAVSYVVAAFTVAIGVNVMALLASLLALCATQMAVYRVALRCLPRRQAVWLAALVGVAGVVGYAALLACVR